MGVAGGKKSDIEREGKCEPCRLAGVAERERSVGREAPDGGRRLRSGVVGWREPHRKPKAWVGGERAELQWCWVERSVMCVIFGRYRSMLKVKGIACVAAWVGWVVV